MTTRERNVMDEIQREKIKEIEKKDLQPLDPEGQALAEHKRFTFDIVNTPVDPLR